MKQSLIGVALVVVCTLLGRVALAQATSESTALEKCQKTAQAETAKYATGIQKNVGDCLQKIAGVVVKGNQSSIDVSAATATCLTKFYALGRSDAKSLGAKMEAKIVGACGSVSTADIAGPTSPTLSQPLDAERIDAYCANFAVGASDLSKWLACLQSAAECQARQQIAVDFPRAPEWLRLMNDEFTSLPDSDSKKTDAQAALQLAHNAIDARGNDDVADIACGLNTSSATATAADMLSGATAYVDGQKVTGTAALGANVDGGDGQKTFSIPDGLYRGSKTATANDAKLVSGNIRSTVTIFGVTGSSSVVDTSSGTATASDIASGKTAYVSGLLVAGTLLPSTCGNGAIDGAEQCDQANLNGKSCTAKGFTGGTLRCGAGCVFDTGGCYATRYADNSDGTITDNQTGLMWEKKVKLDGPPEWANLHDADNFYRWAGVCSLTGRPCQPTDGASAACTAGVEGDATGCAQCTGGDGTCNAANTVWTWLVALNTANFGAHSDWRLPKRTEVQGLVDYVDTASPLINVAFQGASCGAGCADITSPACACTQSSYYWSASTRPGFPYRAWYVSFDDGRVYHEYYDGGDFYVRAVRGGM